MRRRRRLVWLLLLAVSFPMAVLVGCRQPDGQVLSQPRNTFQAGAQNHRQGLPPTGNPNLVTPQPPIPEGQSSPQLGSGRSIGKSSPAPVTVRPLPAPGETVTVDLGGYWPSAHRVCVGLLGSRGLIKNYGPPSARRFQVQIPRNIPKGQYELQYGDCSFAVDSGIGGVEFRVP